MNKGRKNCLLHIIGEENIAVFYYLLSGQINDGHGYVQTEEGAFVGVEQDENEVCIHIIKKERDIHLFNSNPVRYMRKILWDVSFMKPEATKICTELKKIIEKSFGKILTEKTESESSDEAKKD